MPEIVGVSFRTSGKVYYFDPAGFVLEAGQQVIVETSRGMECGNIVIENRALGSEEFNQPLKKVLRVATERDLRQVARNEEREQYALEVCARKVEKHNLEMKLIDAEYAFDRSKVIIYFTADGRVDFRALVRDLASVLKTRIELRQIGVRDEAKLLGGIGICGREFCCSSFLTEFEPVSIRIAKEQNLSLNPSKISGACGRLMCCLRYEEEAYKELNRITPQQGHRVSTELGDGVVVDSNVLSGNLQIKITDDSGTESVESFHRDQVTRIRRGGN